MLFYYSSLYELYLTAEIAYLRINRKNEYFLFDKIDYFSVKTTRKRLYFLPFFEKAEKETFV